MGADGGRCRWPCFLLAWGCADTPDAGTQADAAIIGASVVDVAAGEVVPDQTVVVREGRIVEVGHMADVVLADDVPRIDGTGRFLLPGLTDMHAHVFTEDGLVPYLANGITTVRNMWAARWPSRCARTWRRTHPRPPRPHRRPTPRWRAQDLGRVHGGRGRGPRGATGRPTGRRRL